MFSSWPSIAFVAGVKIGVRQPVRLAQPLGQRVPADRAARAVVLPARACEIAAHDALDRQHLEPPALHRAAVVADREHVVRDDPASRVNQKPESPVSTRPLSGISVGRMTSKVEIRSLRDEQQALVVERVDLADLPGSDVLELQAWAGSPLQ